MERGPRVGVGVIIRRDDEVLLIRRQGVHGSGSWSTPGGHLEEGEGPEECAAREAREETGVEVEDLAFRALTNDVFAADGKHYITIWMEGRYAGGEAHPAAEYEMSSLGWFRWDELPTPLFLPLENLLTGRCYPPPSDGP